LIKRGKTLKRENCPFCGNRWVRSSNESPVKCPNCKCKFDPEIVYANREFGK
jgi:uncharacterized Zn finger protein (UPF0148 family)